MFSIAMAGKVVGAIGVKDEDDEFIISQWLRIITPVCRGSIPIISICCFLSDSVIVVYYAKS
jgi:hypothetical protein